MEWKSLYSVLSYPVHDAIVPMAHEKDTQADVEHNVEEETPHERQRKDNMVSEPNIYRLP